MEVYTDIPLDELQRLPINEDDKLQLQFTNPPTSLYCEVLNDLLLKGKKTTVRFYSYEGGFKDLSFLKHVTNIRKIVLHDEKIENLFPVAQLRNLESFVIGKTRKKSLDLMPLAGLKILASIEVNGQDGIMGIIAESSILQELYLERIKIGDLKQFSHLKKLKNFDLTNCRCFNYSELKKLENLEYLSLAKQHVDDVNFIGELVNIEFLRLESLPIKELPDFSKCGKFKNIFLASLNEIETYQRLSTASSLTEIGLRNVKKVEISDFYFLRQKGNKIKIVADIKGKKSAVTFYDFLESIHAI